MLQIAILNNLEQKTTLWPIGDKQLDLESGEIGYERKTNLPFKEDDLTVNMTMNGLRVDSQLPALISIFIFVWSISEAYLKNNWMRGEQACSVASLSYNWDNPLLCCGGLSGPFSLHRVYHNLETMISCFSTGLTLTMSIKKNNHSSPKTSEIKLTKTKKHQGSCEASLSPSSSCSA